MVHGVLLGLENYIPKYKTGNEGAIDFSMIPIYTATKFAILGISKAWGDVEHYN